MTRGEKAVIMTALVGAYGFVGKMDKRYGRSPWGRKEIVAISFYTPKENSYLGKDSINDMSSINPLIVSVLFSTSQCDYIELHGSGRYFNYNYYVIGYSLLGFNVKQSDDSIYNISQECIKINNEGNALSISNLEQYRKKLIPNSYGLIQEEVPEEYLQYISHNPIGVTKYDADIN